MSAYILVSLPSRRVLLLQVFEKLEAFFPEFIRVDRCRVLSQEKALVMNKGVHAPFRPVSDGTASQVRRGLHLTLDPSSGSSWMASSSS